MAKLKELGNTISGEEKDRIMEEFRGTLLDFCESCIPNGSRRGDEWDCSDIFNSELQEGDRGSCSVNLKTGKFRDQNEGAEVRKGGPYTLFSAITGLKGAAAYRAMRQWNEDGTLPDGTKGARSDRKIELSEGSTIEAQDEFEKERVKAIGVFQDWKEYHAGVGDDGSEAAKNDNRIAWVVSDIFTRRWLQAVEVTQVTETREKFAGELAEYRGLSKEVFFWLIDNGYIASVYERKEIKQEAMTTDEGVWEEPPPIVKEWFNIAFPVCRDVTPDMEVEEWAGKRYYSPISKIAFSPYPEEIGLPKPTVQFFGMHIPWTDKDGKKHWRYNPKGCPAAPYVIGDVRTADLVVIAESTWDIIAYIDLRGLWRETGWTAIATRGAGNAKRIPADQIKDGAVVLRLLQNDAGNAAWVTSLPAMPQQVEHREICPPEGIKDLNDWMREAGAEKVLKAIW